MFPRASTQSLGLCKTTKKSYLSMSLHSCEWCGNFAWNRAGLYRLYNCFGFRSSSNQGHSRRIGASPTKVPRILNPNQSLLAASLVDDAATLVASWPRKLGAAVKDKTATPSTADCDIRSQVTLQPMCPWMPISDSLAIRKDVYSSASGPRRTTLRRSKPGRHVAHRFPEPICK
jgi:hypothetical protein